MITTNNEEYDKKLRLLRHHGMSVSDTARHNVSKVIIEKYLMTAFNCRMSDIQAADGIEQLGISVESLRGLSPDEMFDRYAEALAKLEDPTMRTKLAMDIFGRAGGNINKMLANGIEGFREMKEEAEAFGLVVSTKAGKAAANFNDSLTRVYGSMRGIKNKISELLLTPLSGAFNALAQWIAGNRVQIVRGLQNFAIAARSCSGPV